MNLKSQQSRIELVTSLVVHQRQTTQEGEHVDYVTEELSVNTEMNMRRNGAVKYNSSGEK